MSCTSACLSRTPSTFAAASNAPIPANNRPRKDISARRHKCIALGRIPPSLPRRQRCIHKSEEAFASKCRSPTSGIASRKLPSAAVQQPVQLGEVRAFRWVIPAFLARRRQEDITDQVHQLHIQR